MQPANLPDDGGLPRSVAIVGTGVIGRSWLRVFSRTGVPVRFWDASEEALERAAAWHDGEARRDRAPATLVRQCGSLDEALEHADYVQESGPENLALKQELYRDLDRLAPPDAILASSTSALDMTEIAAGLEGCNRCVVAHPVNPPHVVPVVEVLGGTRTDPSVVEATVRVLRAVGQSPVVLKRFVPGFLLNRMQAALVREALALLESGVADADAIDAVIRDGLGLRWALMGPFGVANTNADG
ncbi:MAG: 3-hydroxyacyl-CoA dehydrogenase NAD-binding domain-containing protein, partial [Gemmatimonadaceae bacterium]